MSSDKKRSQSTSNMSNTSPSQFSRRAKVKMLQNKFPALPDDICEEVLSNFGWKVEAAIRHLSTEKREVEDDRTYARIAKNSSNSNETFERQSTPSSSNSMIWKKPFSLVIGQNVEKPVSLPTLTQKNSTQSPSSVKKNCNSLEEFLSQLLRETKNPTKTKLVSDFKKEIKNVELCRIVWDLVKRKENDVPKTIILLRGAPGSGKSTLAKLIIGVCESGICLSTDDFFKDQSGKYVFNRDKLGSAHSSNQSKCEEALKNGITPIIIDNTNTEIWEMIPYVKCALEYSYTIEILEPSTSWKTNVKVLTEKNSHGVPKHNIKKMLERYDKTVTVPALVTGAGGTYEKYLKAIKDRERSCTEGSLRNESKVIENGKFEEDLNEFGNMRLRNEANTSWATNFKFSSGDESPQKDTAFDDESSPPKNEGLSQVEVPENLIQFSDEDCEELITLGANSRNDECIYDKWEEFSVPRDNDSKDGVTEANILTHSLDALCEIFPNISTIVLSDVLSQCNGNVERAIERLADGEYSKPDKSAAHFSRQRSLSSPKRSKKKSPRRSMSSSDNYSDQSTCKPGVQSSVEVKESFASVARRGSLDRDSPVSNHVTQMTKPDIFDNTDIFVETDGENWFSLELDPKFIQQVNDQFGDSSIMLESGSASHKIRIPPKMAFKLFQYYSLDVMKKEGTKKVELDTMKSNKTNNCPDSDIDDIISDLNELDLMSCSKENDLKKVMDLEARLAARHTKDMQLLREQCSPNMSINIVIHEIQRKFPKVSRQEIESTFAMCGFNRQKTIDNLQSLNGTPAEDEDKENGWKLVSSPRQSRSSSFSASTEKTAQEWREEANKHHITRMEYYNKTFSGQRAATVYYFDKYREHTKMMKDCHSKAFQKISEAAVERNSNELDLHHLLTSEAKQLLKAHLKYQTEYMKIRGMKTLDIKVITGRGKNSPNGEARLGPAVVDYLRQNHFSFEDLNGSIIVHLRQSP